MEEYVCKAEGWHLYPLMLVDSEPKEECYHSLNWVMAGKAKPNGGGSEMGKQPHVRMESARSTTWCEMLPTYQEEPKLTMEGWLYAL